MKTCIRHLSFVLLFLMVGCCAAQAQSNSKMESLGSALILLIPSVDEVVCCDSKAEGMSDDELLRYATSNNPKKLDPFVDYTLKVKRQNGHAAVLVCTADGQTALLEDAGCTFKMEQHHWKASPALPCDFTLDLDTVCPGP
ncbi:MAG: hypothetical protein Q7U56_04300 [Humidesulfovibrio sp.]|nr:hypothetical protein [Humidesulfovibrio sp.]